uniref:Uncharacterized protein n=1 Tax=Arundo donax TaxID=35708 RepID=A0A0A9E7D1_ARUDO
MDWTSPELLIVVGGVAGATAGTQGDVGDPQPGVVHLARPPVSLQRRRLVRPHPLAAGAGRDDEAELQRAVGGAGGEPHVLIAPPRHGPPRQRRGAHLCDFDGGDVGLAALVEETDGQVAWIPATLFNPYC